MPSDIALTSALHSNLQSLQKTKSVACARTNEQNTGENQTGDSSVQDFCVQSLGNRAGDLSQLLDDLSTSIKTLEQTKTLSSTLSLLIQSAESLVMDVRDGDTEAGEAQTTLDKIVSQIAASIDENAGSSTVSLLSGEDLVISFNDNPRNDFVISGIDFTPEALGFDTLSLDSSGQISDALEKIGQAQDKILSFTLTVTQDLGQIRTRQDFAQETINVLETGAETLNATALSDDGANLLALQTRHTLSKTDLSLASSTQGDILHLF